MAANYSILPHYNLVVVRYSGTVTAEESMNVFLAYFSSRDARLGRSALVDCSQLDEFDLCGEPPALYLRRKLNVLPPGVPPVRVAILAPRDHQMAIVHPFMSLIARSPRMNATVHRTRASALQALGARPELLQDAVVFART